MGKKIFVFIGIIIALFFYVANTDDFKIKGVWQQKNGGEKNMIFHFDHNGIFKVFWKEKNKNKGFSGNYEILDEGRKYIELKFTPNIPIFNLITIISTECENCTHIYKYSLTKEQLILSSMDKLDDKPLILVRP